MVLISHSMGGLLSQMQAVTTRRVLWDDVFQSDADRLYGKVPADHVVKRALMLTRILATAGRDLCGLAPGFAVAWTFGALWFDFPRLQYPAATSDRKA